MERKARARAPRSPQEPRTPPGWGEDTRETVERRSGGRCEVRVHGCSDVATDLHHRQRRREGNHTPVNALHCCRHCHQTVHALPAVSRAAGWIVSAYADPATAAVRVRGRMVMFTDDGHTAPASV